MLLPQYGIKNTVLMVLGVGRGGKKGGNHREQLRIRAWQVSSRLEVSDLCTTNQLDRFKMIDFHYRRIRLRMVKKKEKKKEGRVKQ